MATEIIEIIIANTMALMNMGIGIMDAATTGTAAGIRLAVAVGAGPLWICGSDWDY